MKNANPEFRFVSLHNLLCAAAILFTFLFVLFTKSGFLYDEPYYLNNIALIHKYGLSDQFLKELAGPAGPTHAVLHWLWEPVTALKTTPVRMVNVVLLWFTVLFTFLSLKKLNVEESLAKALCFMCMPMVFVCTDMALTEMPALFFLSAAIYLLLIAIDKNTVLPALIGGALMSLAILGRQPYLLVLFALPILLYKKSSELRRWITLGAFFITAILLPLYVFNIWGGLVPHTGGDIATRQALSPLNFFLSLGYAFMITIFLAPSFLIKIGKKQALYLVITLLVTACVCFWAGFSLPVMATVSKKLLPDMLFKYYGAFMGAILVTLGLYFIASVANKILPMRNDVLKLFFMVSCIFILFSTLKITHQFSSRYVFQAAPFFILFLSDHIKFSLSDIGLRIVAMAIGITSLLSYF